jgi:uncharacterized membrane protein YcaP (DUF421 family)
MDSIFQVEIPYLNLFVRAIVVYLSVLLLLRIAGKRQMGQMEATEFVALLLISNAVQNAMNGGDNSLAAGLFLACVLIGASALITYFTFKSRIIRSIFEGTPTLLIHKGKVISTNISKELISESELRTLLRKQGFHHVNDVEVAILEADGTLSITGIHSHPASTPT